MKKIVLASSSPRRCELLSKLGITFDTIPSSIDESIFKNLDIIDLVKILSKEKAIDAFNKLNNKSNNICIIGCDTVVYIDDKILGKPINKEDALNMLMLLNNKKHTVFTGLTILGLKDNNFFEETIYSSSNVYFSKFTKDELISYVNTLDPMDKSGAYGIQDKGSFLVSKIEGDFYSIIGLPINRLYYLLKKYDFLI